VLFASVIVAILSLRSLLCRPVIRGTAGPWLVGLCLVGSGAVAVFASPGPMAIALAALGGALALGCLLRAEAPRRSLVAALRPLAWPRVQALLLLGVSVSGAFGWVVWLDEQSTPPMLENPFVQDGAESPTLQRVSQVGWTDRGTVVPLYRPTGLDESTLNTSERRLAEGLFALRVIATGRRTTESNCHGWMFAGNRFWLMSTDVARILVDNGYQTVIDPALGDLVIYRDSDGLIVHSAIMRGHTGAGELLLESKWGPKGCFVHTPKNQPFGERFEYYRSPRKGHRLSGTKDSYQPAQPAS
jgi:hypothetical protein